MPRLISRKPPINGHFTAPASKPETQRALIFASLAEGISAIRGALVARETEVMIDACRALGAKVSVADREFRITGAGGDLFDTSRTAGTRYIWAAGSALVGRVFATLGSALPDRVVVDGNNVLRGRPFAPLFSALEAKGVLFDYFDAKQRLPCATRTRELPGGHYRLATSVSSQFVTALMVPAPFAKSQTVIELTGAPYSLSYIRQTADMMRQFGVPAELHEATREIVVPGNTSYGSRIVALSGDYTAASYILGAAFVTRGSIVVANMDPNSLQGERAILDILAELGAEIRWIDHHTLALDCSNLPQRVDAAFDLSDSPNILPTVAAIAATVPGRVRLTGARLTQNHKSPRISAMAEELAKAGIEVALLYDSEGACDGIDVCGRAVNPGDVAFSSHGDHRIFMSLALFALSCEHACAFSESEDTGDSFPEFLNMLGFADPRDRAEAQQGNVDDELQLVERAG